MKIIKRDCSGEGCQGLFSYKANSHHIFYQKNILCSFSKAQNVKLRLFKICGL